MGEELRKAKAHEQELQLLYEAAQKELARLKVSATFALKQKPQQQLSNQENSGGCLMQTSTMGQQQR